MINFLLNCWRSYSKYTLNRLQSPKKTQLIRLRKVRTITWQCHISVTPGRNTIHVVIAFAESSELIAKDTLQIITTVFVLSKYHQIICTIKSSPQYLYYQVYILHNPHAPTSTFTHLNSPPGLQKSYIWSRILSAGPMRQRNYWILGQNVNKEYLSKQFQLKKDL